MPVSLGEMRSRYTLYSGPVDIGRMAAIADVANNLGAFIGKNYLGRFGGNLSDYNATSGGTMTNASRSFDVTVRICIGINGSGSANPSKGWIWSKSNGGNGGNIYIYNNHINVHVGTSNSSTLTFAIPSSWTNDVIREIVWCYDQGSTSRLAVDGIVRDNASNLSYVGFVGTAGLHQFLNLPNSGDIGSGVPTASRVSPVNIVAKRCDVWRTHYQYN